MTQNTTTLPDDPQELTRLLRCFEKEIDLLREHVRLLYAKLFGKVTILQHPICPRSGCPAYQVLELNSLLVNIWGTDEQLRIKVTRDANIGIEK